MIKSGADETKADHYNGQRNGVEVIKPKLHVQNRPQLASTSI